MLIIHDLQYKYSFDIGYGTLKYYRDMIAKVFGVDTYYRLALYPPYMQNIDFVSAQEKDYNFEYIYAHIPEVLADFLFASNCQAEFSQKECSELYHLLKDIVLPEGFSSVVTCYNKEIDLHQSFVKVFAYGRYKYNGVVWE